MHPIQEQLKKQASELTEKLAKGDKKQGQGGMLWKYVDPTGNEFWLKEKKLTVRSPYTGKTFTAKPERETPSGVGQDLREEAKAALPGGAGPGGKTQNKRKKADWQAEGAAHPGELKELEAILEAHGYDPKDAKKLNEEGMGPYELEHRIKSTSAGGMGSLEFTHGIHKKKG
jgi:hypothetical protein